MEPAPVAGVVGEFGYGMWILTWDGDLAGFVEMLNETDGSVEITLFGLVEKYHGRGFGKHLLTHAVETAWGIGANRVWLHTCTLDGPKGDAELPGEGVQAVQAGEVHQDVEGLDSRRHLRHRQDPRPLLRDRHGVFEVRRQRSHPRHHGPAVRQGAHPGPPMLIIGSMAMVMPGMQPRAGAVAAEVRHLRLLVELGADAVAHQFAHHAVAGRLRHLLHRVADVADLVAGVGRRDAGRQGPLGDLEQRLHGRRDLARPAR